ncbi:MAG: ATP-binding protein [Methylococcaceae bacterium]
MPMKTVLIAGLLSTVSGLGWSAPEVEPSEPSTCVLQSDTQYGLCYDSLGLSTLWVLMPAVCFVVIFRLRQQIKAYERSQSELMATHHVVERLARQEPLTEVLKSIISLLEGKRTGVCVSLITFGQQNFECVHISGSSSNHLGTFIRMFDSTQSLIYSTAINPAPFQKLATWHLSLRRKQPVFVRDDEYELATADFRRGMQIIGIKSVWSEPVLNENKEVLGVVNFYYRKGTARKAEDDLLMEEARNMLAVVTRYFRNTTELRLMQVLVERNHDPFFLCIPDQAFLFCFVNTAFARHFGYSKQKALTLKISDFDPNYPRHKLDELFQLLKQNGSHILETETYVSGGRLVPVEVMIFYLEHEGQEYLAGSFRDITERNQAELNTRMATQLAETNRQHQQLAESRARLLQGIIEYSGTPEFLLDPHDDYRLVYANSAALEHFGHTDEMLMQMRISDFDRNITPEQLDNLWDTLKTVGHLSYETVHNTVSVRNISMEVNCHYLRHDQREYIACYCQDISPRKVHEDGMKKARQEAEKALAVSNRFLAHMSHELRTPLNGILGLSHLATESDSLILVREYLEQINHSGEYLLSVINNILDFSRIEAGGIILNNDDFSVKKLWRDIEAIIGFNASSKQIALNCQIDVRVPEHLNGDVQRLRQILLHLLTNAIKFTDQGEVKVLVESKTVGYKTWVRWTVIDSGIGINMDDQARLFDPFVQLDQSNSRRHGGSGLGLAIAQNLVKLMGGQGIVLNSTPGVGSRFTVELPFKRLDGPDITVLVPNQQSETPLEGLHVLIVEDNYINQVVAKALVEKLGARVSVADDGSQALVALTGHAADTYDIILMDIQMPVMDGYTATRRIRNELGMTDIPIIAVSAHAMSEDRAASLAAGMNAHVTKPVNRKDLLKHILDFLPEHKRPDLQRTSGLVAEPSLDQAESPSNRSVLKPMSGPFQGSLQALPKALSKLNGDEKLYGDMARLFVDDHSDDVQRVRTHLFRQEYDEARRVVHILRDTAQTLGLAPLSAEAQTLNVLLQNPELHDELPATLTHLETRMNDAIRALQQLIR